MKPLITMLMIPILALGQTPSAPVGLGVTTNGTPKLSAGNQYCSPSGTWIGAATDGPAKLPKRCVNSALQNTPSPGATHGPFTTLGALQSAINAGACGDIYTITAGTDLGTGTITLPRKNCDDQHWNLIESTGITNPSFPAAGVRMTPCFGGVASLPGRPSYPCSVPANLLFRIAAATTSNAIKVLGDHWRVIGALVTRVPTPGAQIFQLVDFTVAGVPQADHIILDRIWYAGIPGTFPVASAATDTSTTRAIYLGQSNTVAMVDSYFSDFYTASQRSPSTDAQCVAGGFGGLANTGWGNYKFVNNHCEASSEGILMGGGNGPPLTPAGCTILVNCNDDTPSDIEVRQNYFFKPLQWNGNTTVPASVGWPVVKNGFEMKTAIRALFEGNVIENCWYNAQVCYAFSIAPVNQQSGGTPSVPTCPTCVIKDVTYRANYSYNVAYGIGLYAFAPGGCPACVPQGGNGVSIHDNLIGDNLNLGSLTSQNAGDQMELYAIKDPTNQGLAQLNNVTISHNTFVKGIRSIMEIGIDATGQMHNWTVQNNIWSNANFGVQSMQNSPTACDAGINTGKLFPILQNCISTWTWDHNAVFNWNQGALGTNWPTNGTGAGNLFTVGLGSPSWFTGYGTGDSNFNPSNYLANPSGPLHHAASDGADVGADIPALLSQIAGVRQ